MKYTRREQEVMSYLRKEAQTFRKAAEPKYMSDQARDHYLGMADGIDRMVSDILEGEHRKFAQGTPNATERGLGYTSTD